MKSYKRSHEPVAWSLFGAGGMAAALILPGLMLTTLLIFPAAEPEALYRWLMAVMDGWLLKLVVLGVLATTFFHAAHRIYHGLHDLHIERFDRLQLLLCYGGATLLSLLTAVALWRI